MPTTTGPAAPATSLNTLLIRVAEGDPTALKALYQDTAGRLFAILTRMVKRRDVAEELLQDTFVTVWQKASQFDPERGEANAWLSSIARRKAIDRLRVSQREKIGLDAIFDCVGASEERESVPVDPETRITLSHLRKYLKPDVNRALELCYVIGLTHEELAEELNVPLGTAKSWVRRGLNQLKDSMTAA
ncbi:MULTISPECIES: sigma-70 family RNA polymerase sigma factor [Asticcacaulis]|uniref:sigma-70 family RNA polymerase sigma factor n=1 Tax=Asticcacaulis TaxID=76890 RepID=UPI001AE2687B|nr:MULTISPECIES: sigma-70 family RNA polymerase sigma factor [Asticcacaulis]MBP2157852.1 RNA polymerase sigma-70 factor (ECF subfamily) [Asticcacaulis solisilvae]MDR6798897.1 RNA polymerase sigma-70 factor (ECF subfamily) [Asticcacaulis sp. BE141]